MVGMAAFVAGWALFVMAAVLAGTAASATTPVTPRS